MKPAVKRVIIHPSSDGTIRMKPHSYSEVFLFWVKQALVNVAPQIGSLLLMLVIFALLAYYGAQENLLIVVFLSSASYFWLITHFAFREDYQSDYKFLIGGILSFSIITTLILLLSHAVFSLFPHADNSSLDKLLHGKMVFDFHVEGISMGDRVRIFMAPYVWGFISPLLIIFAPFPFLSHALLLVLKGKSLGKAFILSGESTTTLWKLYLLLSIGSLTTIIACSLVHPLLLITALPFVAYIHVSAFNTIYLNKGSLVMGDNMERVS